VEGVVAITPNYIAQLLSVTGPVAVPGYKVTVTSDNLVATIHYFQFQTTDNGVPSSDGTSSVRKRFTAVLGQTVFARVRSLPLADMQRVLLHITPAAIKAKDVQLYIADADVQGTLRRARLTNELMPVQGDALGIVDNNIGSNKAQLYVQEAAQDDVTLASNGTSTHRLTITYRYTPAGDVYGPRRFLDEAQVFAPTGSTLVSHAGLNVADAPTSMLGRAVLGGRISLAPGETRTVTYVWTSPQAPAATAAYTLAVARQAGSQASLSVTIHPPSGARAVTVSSPLRLSSGVATYSSDGALDADLSLSLKWQNA
jgi:hypothetical protein